MRRVGCKEPGIPVRFPSANGKNDLWAHFVNVLLPGGPVDGIVGCHSLSRSAEDRVGRHAHQPYVRCLYGAWRNLSATRITHVHEEHVPHHRPCAGWSPAFLAVAGSAHAPKGQRVVGPQHGSCGINQKLATDKEGVAAQGGGDLGGSPHMGCNISSHAGGPPTLSTAAGGHTTSHTRSMSDPGDAS